LPGLSRSLLSRRLRQFEVAGLVEQIGSDYLLTDAGEELRPLVMGFASWGAKWVFGEPDPDELDAELLVWWIHDRLDVSGLPGKRQVFHIRFSDDPTLFWIVVENGVSSVCLDDPGFDVQLTIDTDVSTLYQVWEQRISLGRVLKSGRLQTTGTDANRRRLGQIFRFSPVAPYVEAASR